MQILQARRARQVTEEDIAIFTTNVVASLLQEFDWLYGVSLEKRDDRYFISVHIQPEMELVKAKALSKLRDNLNQIPIVFHHGELAASST